MAYKDEAKASFKSAKYLFQLAAEQKAKGNAQLAKNYRRAARAKAKEAQAKLRLARQQGEFGKIENDFDEQARVAERRAKYLKKKGRVAASEYAKKQAAEHRAMAANIRKYGTPHAPVKDPGAQHEAAAQEARDRARELRLKQLKKAEDAAAEAEERHRVHIQEAASAEEEAKKHRAEGRALSAQAAEEKAKGHHLAAKTEKERAEEHRRNTHSAEADQEEARARQHETSASEARAAASSGYADPAAHEAELAEEARVKQEKRDAKADKAAGVTARKKARAQKKAVGAHEKIEREESRAEKRAKKERLARQAEYYKRSAGPGDAYVRGLRSVGRKIRADKIAIKRYIKRKKELEELDKKRAKELAAKEAEKRAEKRREWLGKVFYKITGRKLPPKKLTLVQQVAAQAEVRKKAKENIAKNRELLRKHKEHLRKLKKDYKKVPLADRAQARDEIAKAENLVTETQSIIKEHEQAAEQAADNIEEIHKTEAERLPNRVRAVVKRWSDKWEAHKKEKAEKKKVAEEAQKKKTAERNQKIADYTNRLFEKFGFSLVPPDEQKKEAARHIEGGMAGWGTFALMAVKGIRPPNPTEIVKEAAAKAGPPGQLHKGKKGGIFYYTHDGKKVYIDKMNVGKWKISHTGKLGKLYSLYKAFKAGKHGARLYH